MDPVTADYIPAQYVVAGFTVISGVVGALWLWIRESKKEDNRRFDECLAREREQADKFGEYDKKFAELEGKYVATKDLHDAVLDLVREEVKRARNAR